MIAKPRRGAPSLLLPALLAAAVLVAGVNALYTVSQAQQALVLRLGAPVLVVNAGPSADAAGLYAKWPFIDQVVRLDRRLIPLQGGLQEVTTEDGQRLSAQAALSYRIVDPLRFYGASGDRAERLRHLLDAGVARSLAAAREPDIVSGRGAALMQGLLLDLRRQAQADRLGVQIADVHLLQAAPPSAEAEATGRRMQDAEAQQAADIRVQGEAHRREGIAAADREAADIRGGGEQQALEVRGEGDAERAAILGSAYDADPDFARFFRRLEAYDQALNPANTTLVLSADNAFLDLFGHGPGASAARR